MGVGGGKSVVVPPSVVEVLLSLVVGLGCVVVEVLMTVVLS